MLPLLLSALGGYLIGSASDKFALGGGVQYKDLSKMNPEIVNETKPKTKNVPEIDIVIKDKIKIPNAKKIQGSKDAVDIFMSVWGDQINVVEHMNVLLLNRANMPIGYFQHSKGGIDGTIADIEVISATALKSLAKGVILAHNHPSNNTLPSDADKRITSEMKKALESLKIVLLDSIIVTPEGKYFSFNDEGYL